MQISIEIAGNAWGIRADRRDAVLKGRTHSRAVGYAAERGTRSRAVGYRITRNPQQSCGLRGWLGIGLKMLAQNCRRCASLDTLLGHA